MRPPASPPAGSAPITRRVCTTGSAILFAASFAAAVIAQAALFMLASPPGNLMDGVLKPAVLIIYLGAPPAAGIGAIIGYELYRLASGSRPPRVTKWYVWVLAFVLLRLAVIFIYLQHRRRDALILQQKRPGLLGPVLYGVLMLGWAVYMADLTRTLSGSAAFYLVSLSATPLSLFVADCLAVNAVAKWMQTGRLAPPESHTFQFSLATLFFGVLALGAYLSGAVVLLR